MTMTHPARVNRRVKITSVAGAQLANPLTWNNLIVLENLILLANRRKRKIGHGPILL